jgi:hypothetical protein
MNEQITTRIERAKYLLQNAIHAAMATVNADGSPHNTPFFFIHDDTLKQIYWGSHPASLHSQNVQRTGQIFVVVYESTVGGGLYIKADHAHELAGAELETALKVHNAARVRLGKTPIALSYYQGDSPQRMYGATPTNFYVNNAQRDEQGKLIEDIRYEITREDITS